MTEHDTAPGPGVPRGAREVRRVGPGPHGVGRGPPGGRRGAAAARRPGGPRRAGPPGILQSIASRNDHGAALAALERHGLADYFLYPQIHWNAKSASVRAIARALNLGLDTFAFVDDDPFERGEVAHDLPEVLCVDAAEAAGLAGRPEFTRASSPRTRPGAGDVPRRHPARELEAEYVGPKEGSWPPWTCGSPSAGPGRRICGGPRS
ncbi:hypothetical protein NKH77_48320 [Streptomyces sp. M19]